MIVHRIVLASGLAAILALTPVPVWAADPQGCCRRDRIEDRFDRREDRRDRREDVRDRREDRFDRRH
jgi:hypothetical protein